MSTPTATAGARRGRKPRGRGGSNVSSPRITSQDIPSSVRWSIPPESKPGSPAPSSPYIPSVLPTSTSNPTTNQSYPSTIATSYSAPSALAGLTLPFASATQSSTTPGLDAANFLRMPMSTYPGSSLFSSAAASGSTRLLGAGEDDGDGDDELLPAMADDDYSAQLSWNSQSKDNLKVLMDNFTPEQYERFEAYRRHALPKQAVRKVIQQVMGQQVSQPVAQIVAGFGKVFVGEIVEKARAVQARKGESGPLSPDHLREAYRMYQEETGRVGSARPLRAKRLFVR